VLEPIQYLYTN